MNNLFQACSSAVCSRTSRGFLRSSICGYLSPSWKTSFDHVRTSSVNLDLLLNRFRVQCYSSKESSGTKKSSRTKKSAGIKTKSQSSEPVPAMKEDKESFFVVRKGDLVGVYRNLSDCQSQVGSSVCDPPVSVYKGYGMPKGAEEYLVSCGLKNALYSIRAADLTEDLFGSLVPCPLQPPSSSKGETSNDHLPKKRSHDMLWSDYGCLNFYPSYHQQRSCTLEFDGASKGNPGQAGAGAVIKADDGSMICRLREGLGIATSNVAEYRGIILGLKYALNKGFTNIRVRGDSKLVCMQIQGLWKVKNQNISTLYDEAKKLKDRFLSFQILHVLRDLNSDADAQANLAIDLPDGQIQEEIDK